MKYAFYPGCSLTGSANEYDQTSRAVMAALDLPLNDLTDWNCCGATAAAVSDPDLTVALSARNLFLAEQAQADVAVACASCYTNLRRAREIVTGSTAAGTRVRSALAESGVAVTGASQVRHLLEIIVREIGLETVKAKVKKPLAGLKVVAYYGCQLGRPKGGAVHPDNPVELDELLAALGATVVDWNGRTKCCGGATMVTKESAAAELVDTILTYAEKGGADLIVTACPMCHLNLDAYQGRVNKLLHKTHRTPIVYFTQLMGIALGLDPKELGFEKAFISAVPVLVSHVEGVAK